MKTKVATKMLFVLTLTILLNCKEEQPKDNFLIIVENNDKNSSLEYIILINDSVYKKGGCNVKGTDVDSVNMPNVDSFSVVLKNFSTKLALERKLSIPKDSSRTLIFQNKMILPKTLLYIDSISPRKIIDYSNWNTKLNSFIYDRIVLLE